MLNILNTLILKAISHFQFCKFHVCRVKISQISLHCLLVLLKILTEKFVSIFFLVDIASKIVLSVCLHKNKLFMNEII